MNLLIDTNVILNMVFKRTGYEDAVLLFKKIKEEHHCAFITASAVTDLFYIIRKEMHDTEKTYNFMENIFKLVEVLSVTENDIQTAFEQRWKDFEACVQFATAKNNRMVYIDVIQDGLCITLNCHKGSEKGEFFQLVIDANTKRVIKKTSEPDIDASTAYSHIYAMLRNGKPLPSHTVASWG